MIGAFCSSLVCAAILTLTRMFHELPAATPIREISGLTFLLLTFDLLYNFWNEERKDKQPYGKENLERPQFTPVS